MSMDKFRVKVHIFAIKTKDTTVPSPAESAKEVGLRYVHDTQPGIQREKAGKGFRYLNHDGRPVKDRDTLKRIEALVIPPAWKQVWISPLENGHLQASGRDDRNRKQHLYHARWRAVRDENKFHRLTDFARVLPGIRRHLVQDLKKQGLCREKILATVVRLLEISLIRVGNEESARDNHTYGLTTMKNRHATVHGDNVRFHFLGKSNKEHLVEIHDPRVAKIVRDCQHLPGQELFHYVNEAGEKHPIGSHDVNDYLREISGEDFTAKEFRTWGGTLSALTHLRRLGPAPKITQSRKNVVAAIKVAAESLGNTVAVCRKSYIHPVVLEAYLAGTLIPTLEKITDKTKTSRAKQLHVDEIILLEFLMAAARQKKANGDLAGRLRASLRGAAKAAVVKRK
jgi:DNA topoisomerase-1